MPQSEAPSHAWLQLSVSSRAAWEPLDLRQWCLLLFQLGLGAVRAAGAGQPRRSRQPGTLSPGWKVAGLAPSGFQPAVCSDSPSVCLTCIPLCPIDGVTWCLGGKLRPHIGTPLEVPLSLW